MKGHVPELLVKDPSAVLELLRSQGAQCGVGSTPGELSSCPPERHCVVPGGELCVYGSRELGLMTELTREEVCGPIPQPRGASMELGIGVTLAAVLGLAFVGAGRARARAR